MEEGNSLCTVERGATRDIMVAAGVGEGFKVCNTRVSEMENGSFSALGLFKRPPGSMVLQRPSRYQ